MRYVRRYPSYQTFILSDPNKLNNLTPLLHSKKDVNIKKIVLSFGIVALVFDENLKISVIDVQ